MRLWWIGIQNEAFLLVSHDIMVSTFKIGGNRRFFGVCTANFVRCRGGARAIPVPVVSHIPVADVILLHIGQDVWEDWKCARDWRGAEAGGRREAPARWDESCDWRGVEARV